jgi:hypothetical protein
VPTYDITEDVPYDLSLPSTEASFELTDIAYDIVIDDLPFIANVSNQNPYRRETAQYRKDQFDNSTEPGEQSLTGWWLRSQTSWHNGAGISFYEPGTDYEHVSHRFYDSRGIDIWTVGEATLLPELFHAYTGTAGINASTGNDGTNDVLVSGDANGILKQITLNGDSAANTANYTAGATYPDGHNGSNHPFYSVATDGSTYYAVCDSTVHKNSISTLTSDDIYFRYTSGTSTNAFVEYAKGFILFGHDNKIGVMSTTQTPTSASHSSGTVDTFGSAFLSNYATHINSSWKWTDVTSSPGPIYIAGNGGNNSEIWRVNFDEGTNALDMAGATMSLSLPDGELVNAVHYYLGYLAIGTNKGVRICPVNSNGDLVMGPLLIETSYPVKGFTERGSYMYAATKVDDGAYTNGILIRIDLSQQFSDGTFAYAYDLEYRSSLDTDSSDCTEVYNLNDRLVMVIQEDGTAGELQVEHSVNKRDTGWLQTGKIRYGTIEPKFFRYINVQCTTGQGDNITVYTIDKNGQELPLAVLSEGLSNQDVFVTTASAKQEFMSFKFEFNNETDDQELPVLEAYQIKAVPATRRQRIYQYPLSCYDSEMDRFSSIFGYEGRAMEFIQRIESIEETGKFVGVTDYRTGEQYQGIIEEVRFTNESSPDKNNSGFGGLLLVTVRKM